MSAGSTRLSCVILPAGVLFLCDTYMVIDPTAEQIAEMTCSPPMPCADSA